MRGYTAFARVLFFFGWVCREGLDAIHTTDMMMIRSAGMDYNNNKVVLRLLQGGAQKCKKKKKASSTSLNTTTIYKQQRFENI